MAAQHYCMHILAFNGILAMLHHVYHVHVHHHGMVAAGLVSQLARVTVTLKQAADHRVVYYRVRGLGKHIRVIMWCGGLGKTLIAFGHLAKTHSGICHGMSTSGTVVREIFSLGK